MAKAILRFLRYPANTAPLPKQPAMWEVEEDQLSRTFKFNSFIEAFAFMTKIALTAEKLNHHPTFINTYGDVTIRLGTHDAGGEVTDKDHFLAAAIDNIYGD